MFAKSSEPSKKSPSVAVVAADVYDDRLPPSEEKVTGSRAENDGQAEPGVERHHDQHQEVRYRQLQRKNKQKKISENRLKSQFEVLYLH